MRTHTGLLKAIKSVKKQYTCYWRSRLCRLSTNQKLAEDPNNVITCLDNYFTGTRENHVPGVTYIEGDTDRISDLVPNGKEIDIIYHFGEYSRVSTSFEDNDLVWKYNVLGTYRVLEFCRNNNCKIIYSASSTKFGDSGKNIFQSPNA